MAALSSSSSSEEEYCIGIAFSSKKEKTFLTPSFLSHASTRGLRLVHVDPSIPISEQSPRFDLILHKLYDPQWVSNLESFSENNPSVPIVDPIVSIRMLQDRISMLHFVSQLDIPSNKQPSISNEEYTFGIPKQIEVDDSATLEDPATLSGFHFPVIVKPLGADGSSTSHEMSLVFSKDGLLKQPVPVVLQEFVNHGGVIFKIYVAGDYVKCFKRSSISNITEEMMKELSKEGSVAFSQISNLAPAHGREEELAEFPPESFIKDVSQGLRSAMGLNLFNFDMIKDLRFKNHYLVIDINYFPGYEKIPDYETVMTDFIWKIVHDKRNKDADTA